MKSLAIDLRDEAGRETFYDVVRSSDVVVDNFRPGVLARLDIDNETLRTINDRIITLSFIGYGHDGPLAAEPGFDPVLQAMSGMMRAQGGDGEPVFLTIALNDISSAVIGTFATTVALHHPDRTGRGQAITGSLAATSAFMQSGEVTCYYVRPPARRGGAGYAGPHVLDRLYAPADGGWIRLQAREDQRPALAEVGLSGDLAQAIAVRDRDELVEALHATGVDAVAAYNVNEMITHSRLLESEILQKQPRPSGRPHIAPSRLAWFSRTQRTGAMGPPGLGEHSVEILRAAGIAEERIADLLESGSIKTGEPMSLERFDPYR